MGEQTNFSRNIKRFRKAAGWTQSQVAEKIGKSKNYVSELEAGNRTNPSTNVQVALTHAFNCSLTDLWKGDEPADFKTAALLLLEQIPPEKQTFALETMEGWAKPAKTYG